MDMEDCIKSAIERGIKELCFTDHIDLDYPWTGEYTFDYSKYKSAIEEMKDKYEKLISINIGVEMGIQEHITDKLDKYFDDKYFDFVIGSIHSVNKKAFEDVSYFENKSKYESYNEYFQFMYRCIQKYKNYSVLGHLDIVKRYGPYEDKSLNYNDHKDIIDAILKQIIYDGKGIEINTSGIRYMLDSYHPIPDILKAYKRLGGEIITTGSDSHRTEHLAFEFEKAYQLLESCGFKYITIFREGKPIQIKL
jgi:histidinol phosphate phosphatase HisJ family